MARAPRLKVFRTPAGFHDAYVAAPSQKAALKAWGADRDLFARGIAELVTDPDLAKEPLARPGTVIRRSRGTADEQLAVAAKKPHRAAKPSASKRPPKPDRGALDDAKVALTDADARFAGRLRDLDDQAARLARQRRDAERAHDRERDRLARDAERAERDYRAAMDAWRAGAK